MPWWSWIVLWVALVALTLLFLIYCGFRLYRGFSVLLAELGTASSVLDRLSAPELQADGVDLRHFESAVFADPAAMRSAYRSGKAHRRELRRVNRVARRIERGQPVAIRDLPGL